MQRHRLGAQCLCELLLERGLCFFGGSVGEAGTTVCMGTAHLCKPLTAWKLKRLEAVSTTPYLERPGKKMKQDSNFKRSPLALLLSE